MRGHMNFEARLLQQATKIKHNPLKFTCFLEHRFWKHFGRVWEAKNLDFYKIWQKTGSQNCNAFWKAKNHVLRPQNKITARVGRSVRVRGKEHRMGGRPSGQESELSLNCRKALKQALEEGILGFSDPGFSMLCSPYGRGRMCVERTAALQGEYAMHMWRTC